MITFVIVVLLASGATHQLPGEYKDEAMCTRMATFAMAHRPPKPICTADTPKGIPCVADPIEAITCQPK